jgi:hypothetical protein
LVLPFCEFLLFMTNTTPPTLLRFLSLSLFLSLSSHQHACGELGRLSG